MYNVVFLFGVQQFDSLIQRRLYILFRILTYSYIFFFGYYNVLSQVPCATE